MIPKWLASFTAELRRIIQHPSSTLALIVGTVTLVVSGALFSDLISIPADSHFWLLQGVLGLEPLRLAVFGCWLVLWVACVQAAIVSAKAFNHVRL